MFVLFFLGKGRVYMYYYVLEMVKNDIFYNGSGM